MIEITIFSKADGPLTKKISLAPDDKIRSDGSACLMTTGWAQRMRFEDLGGFSSHIDAMPKNEALALGALRDDLPDRVKIATKRTLSGASHSTGLIPRTADYISYRPGHAALVLIDIDTKGMPSAIRRKINEIGGYWQSLLSVLPALKSVGSAARNSTSSGLYRTDTDARLQGPDGQHIYVLLQDGADAARFLRCLHDLCWLHGFGWLMVGAAGQLLERSIVDRTVGAPERLVFEADPIIEPPLAQDRESRRPQVWEGESLNSRRAIPDFSIPDQYRLKRLKAEASRYLDGERSKARSAFITSQRERLVSRGVMTGVAGRAAERFSDGILLPDLVLPFDLPEFAGCTVADVLADPQRFVGATLADPLEGVDYGVCKARVMQRADGSLWIHSFAHGRTTYELKYDFERLAAVLANTPDDELIERFVRLTMVMADLSGLERSKLRLILIKRLGLGARETDRRIREVTAAEAARQTQARAEEQQRERQEKGDLRPRLRVPEQDAPVLVQIDILNDVLAHAAEAPMRDDDGYLVEVHLRRAPGMHELTALGANAEEAIPEQLPAPEQPLLTRLNDIGAAELIEQHIDYNNIRGRSVRLPVVFVRAFLQRRNCSALPRVRSVATMPIILPNGDMLSGYYLDRERGILLRVPERLEAFLSSAEECTAEAVAEAVHFLTDEWLVDVAAGYPGKMKLLALAATILQRGVLPERPAFFIAAGQRGGGKTTVANMIAVATMGQRVSAAGWSFDDDERRKALLSYFGEGVPLIVWDNIARGATISCPSIEKALTAETYTDRVLGSSETRTVPATAVMVFTGNNIGPKGDTASRSLIVRLTADRPDPENREFRHADPIAWTYAHRGQIIRALYTILLGNPRLRGADKRPPETRFKLWWHLIGAPLEYAANQHVIRPALHRETTPEPISFREQFLANEGEDEQGSALSIVLGKLRERWPGSFRAADVVSFMNGTMPGAAQFQVEFMSALEVATNRINPKNITGQTLTWRLKAIVDAPAWVGDTMMCLRLSKASDHQGDIFSVRPLKGGG